VAEQQGEAHGKVHRELVFVPHHVAPALHRQQSTIASIKKRSLYDRLILVLNPIAGVKGCKGTFSKKRLDTAAYGLNHSFFFCVAARCEARRRRIQRAVSCKHRRQRLSSKGRAKGRYTASLCSCRTMSHPFCTGQL